ncbi:MAG TPA: hypothetical protein VMU77_06575 [Acidimicrobiales bacterium]|nr:hypothetical protein [Acidimicrobiales bacterium]
MPITAALRGFASFADSPPGKSTEIIYGWALDVHKTTGLDRCRPHLQIHGIAVAGTPVDGAPVDGAPVAGTPVDGAPVAGIPVPLVQPSC